MAILNTAPAVEMSVCFFPCKRFSRGCYGEDKVFLEPAPCYSSIAKIPLNARISLATILLIRDLDKVTVLHHRQASAGPQFREDRVLYDEADKCVALRLFRVF